MSRIVVIGGSGHVGTYLLPALVARGHEVVNVSRGKAAPYRDHAAVKAVEQVTIDRRAEEAQGKFGKRIAHLNADIVVDMITFELESAVQLVEALRGKIEHYLFCSSIWVYGHATTVPSVETDPTNAIDNYGINKAKIERWLMKQARRDGFPATCIPTRSHSRRGMGADQSASQCKPRSLLPDRVWPRTRSAEPWARDGASRPR
jgi:nucleoside-diphosphate-sugar epimerase